MSEHILTSLIFCPLIGALILAFLPSKVAREGAFCVAFINFLFALFLVANWGGPGAANGFRFETHMADSGNFGPSYHLGVDGLSLWMIVVTALLTPLCILASWREITTQSKTFFVALLALEGALIGAFCSLDVLLFYIFFEATLIPSYLLLGAWGGAGRVKAGLKFLLFTLFGSLLMWVALLFIYGQTPGGGSFDYGDFQAAAHYIDRGTPGIALLVFGAFALAFAIKAPIFPFHSWLPDAYAEAPTGATVLFAGALSKLGAYGFLRFVLPFFPETSRAAAPFLAVLAIAGIIYGAIVAVAQTDLKRLLAYSSLSHIGFVMLGIFIAPISSNPDLALSGAALQMANHAITTGALFLLAGMLFARRGTYQLSQFGGLAGSMPRFTVLFWIALFASIGLPGLNGFVGEFLILQGAMGANFWFAAWAATGVILGAIYMLQAFRLAMFGPLTQQENRVARDISPRETTILAVLLALCVYAGVAPNGFLAPIHADAQKLAATLGNESNPERKVAELNR